jgi:hypothetical protein
MAFSGYLTVISLQASPRDRPRTTLPAASRPLPWARRRPSRVGKPAASSRPLRGAPRNRPGLLRAARLRPGGPRPGVLGVGLAGRRVPAGRLLGPRSSGSAPALGSAVGRGEGALRAGRVWSAGRVRAPEPAGRHWRRPRRRGSQRVAASGSRTSLHPPRRVPPHPPRPLRLSCGGGLGAVLGSRPCGGRGTPARLTPGLLHTLQYYCRLGWRLLCWCPGLPMVWGWGGSWGVIPYMCLGDLTSSDSISVFFRSDNLNFCTY